jgi:hypothetical protein
MRTFELDIFIDCIRDKVYDHISEPINLIGLLPLLTDIDVLKEGMDTNGIILRPFYAGKIFWVMGLRVYRNKVYSIIHLTKPKEELEFHVHSKPGIEIIFKYRFRQFNDYRTQITQTVPFIKVNKLLESFVVRQAKHTQRTLLSNLKVRLEK